MALKTNLPKSSIDFIDFIDGGDGEQGWLIYLKDGWSFDPMANDGSRFIPLNAQHEATSLSVYSVEA